MLSRLRLPAQRRFHHVSLAAFTLSFLLLFAGGALAAPSGKGGGKTTKPTVSIAAPSSGSTASGSVTVSGSASDTSTSLASVKVSVDGGGYRPASGTSSWNFPLNTASYPDGAHTIAAQATDSRGNTAVTSETVTFSNSTPTTAPPPPPPPDTTPPSASISAPAPSSTVSGTVPVSGSASDNVGVSTVQVSVDGGSYQPAQGTTSWSYSFDTTALTNGSHTLTASATDTSGNVSTTSETVTVQNNTTQTLPPGVVQQLVTPEGATIDIYADALGWTAEEIYSLLKANAYQLSVIGPTLTVDVTAQYSSQTSTSASSSNGVWGNYHATITLQANGTSAFANRPDAVAAHEYGHAWTNYYYYVKWQRDWTPWLQERGLVGNPLLNSSFQWTIREMIADDYRLLFGTSVAQSEMAYINPAIPDPRNIAGLKDWFVSTWS